MICNGLLDALGWILDQIYAILPSWTIDIFQIQGQANGSFNDYVGTSIGGMSPFEAMLVYMRKLNWIIPFDQLVIIVNLFLATYAAILGFKAAKWIVGVIRGAGTS